MVKKLTGLVFLFIGIMLATTALAKMPGPDSSELWNYITRTSPYSQWHFWDDHQGMQKGNAPHGALHKVYVNDIAYHSKGTTFDPGAIEVKENYNKDKKLVVITVMYKVKGYNPEAGDWFWVKYTPEGVAKPSGKPTGCISCHGAVLDNDFAMVHKLN